MVVLRGLEPVEMVEVAHHNLSRVILEERVDLREDGLERRARHAVLGEIAATLVDDAKVEVSRAGGELTVDVEGLGLAPAGDDAGDGSSGDAAGGAREAAKPTREVAHARATEAVGAAVVGAREANLVQGEVGDVLGEVAHPVGQVERAAGTRGPGEDVVRLARARRHLASPDALALVPLARRVREAIGHLTDFVGDAELAAAREVHGCWPVPRAGGWRREGSDGGSPSEEYFASICVC